MLMILKKCGQPLAIRTLVSYNTTFLSLVYMGELIAPPDFLIYSMDEHSDYRILFVHRVQR